MNQKRFKNRKKKSESPVLVDSFPVQKAAIEETVYDTLDNAEVDKNDLAADIDSQNEVIHETIEEETPKEYSDHEVRTLSIKTSFLSFVAC